MVRLDLRSAANSVCLHAHPGLDRRTWCRPTATTVHVIRTICAAILIGIFIYYMRRNMVGATLTLPLFFAAMLEDMGFYSLAPIFIIGVMFLFGERRPKPMIAVMALIFGLLMLLFVKILYRWFAGGQYTSVLRYR